jgi:cytochrome o ubiquinol oxidase operon protein cyoD
MTDDAGRFEHDSGDLAPGEEDITLHEPAGGAYGYFLGLTLAVVLTGASFYFASSDIVWQPAIPVVLIALAIAQIGVHLVFFLHITTGPDNTNNVLALAFGVLIVGLVVFGSVWIMDHLDANMMPMRQPAAQAAYGPAG